MIVRPEARRELLDAARWYEEREDGLGVPFVTEIDAVFGRIVEGPERYPFAHRRLRRALVRRFPYAVYVLQDTKDTVVMAVLHQRRSRDVLAERLG